MNATAKVSRLEPLAAICLVLLFVSKTLATDLEPILKGSWFADAGGPALAVQVRNGYAYVAAGVAGLLILDTSNPENPPRVGQYKTADPASSLALLGNYVYVGHAGCSGPDCRGEIVDVTDPANPRLAGEIPSESGGIIATNGNFLYVATLTFDAQTLQYDSRIAIWDVTDPANPVRLGSYHSTLPGIPLSGTLAIAGQYAYLAVKWYNPPAYGGRLEIINISDPAHPERAATYDSNRYANSVAIQGNYAYVAQTYFAEQGNTTSFLGGIEILDVTDPSHPRSVGIYEGQRPADALGIAGSYAYLSAWEGLQIVDITDPAHPQRVSTTNGSGAVVVQDGYAYMAAADGGLNVIDIHDPVHPRATAVALTSAEPNGVAVQGDYAYLSDAKVGLQVLNIGEPANPYWVNKYILPGGARTGAIQGRYAYLAGFWSTLQVVDITNPAKPASAGAVGLAAEPVSIAVDGNYACVLESDNTRIELIDIRNPLDPKAVAMLDLNETVAGVALEGGYVYVAGATSLAVFDFRDPAKPKQVGVYPHGVRGVAVQGNYAYVIDSCGKGGCDALAVLDITDPANPRFVGRTRAGAVGAQVRVRGSYAYIGGRNELQVVDVSNPVDPKQVGRFPMSGELTSLSIQGDYAYAGVPSGNTGGGIAVIYVPNPSNPQRVGQFQLDSPIGLATVTGNYLQAPKSIWDEQASQAHYRIDIVDLGDPSNLRMAGGYDLGDDVRGLAVMGGFSYVATGSGLQIFDLADVASPKQVGRFDLSGAFAVAGAPEFAYLARVYNDPVTSEQARRIDIFNVHNPARPRHVGTYEISRNASGMVLAGDSNDVCVITDTGLELVDLSDPTAPRQVATYQASLDLFSRNGQFQAVAAHGRYLLAVGVAGLEIIDIQDPAHPQRIGASATGQGNAIAVSGNYAYITSPAGLRVLDISDPADPRPVGSNPNIGAGAVAVSGDYVAVVDSNGLTVLHTYMPLAGPPFSFTRKAQFEGDTFQFALEGVPGIEVNLERSTDLVNWQPWTALKLPGASRLIQDTDSWKHPARQFYRARIK